VFNRRNLMIAAGILIIIFVFIGVTKNGKGTQGEAKTASGGQKFTAQELYNHAQTLLKNRDLMNAKAIYQKIYTEYPDYEQIEVVQKELEALNLQIIFSNVPTPNSAIHEVVSGDTLGELAKTYGTTIELIKMSNNLNSNIIRIGQKLRIWTGKFNIFVDKSQNVLFLKQGEEILKVYTVSTGENSSTPIGEFKVTSKLVDPVWFNRGVVVPPESPENVLGSRWLGFDIPGYGIHGTVDPETIGQPVTAGCVRMHNEEVEELYSIITLGTKVVITD